MRRSLGTVDLVPVIATRLTAQIGAARTIYQYDVPSGDLPDRYIVVRASTGESTSDNASGKVDMRTPVIYCTSVARAATEQQAAHEAAWGSLKTVDALIDWRPTVGQASWLIDHFSSLPPTPDNSLPGPVSYAVDEFIPRYQP